MEHTEIVDVDGIVEEATGIQFIGNAYKQPDGTWLTLADVGGALCRVEVRITRPTQENETRT